VAPASFLRARDLDAALTLVREAGSLDGPQPFEPHVIRRLLELVSADRAGYYEIGLASDGRTHTGIPTLYSCEVPEFFVPWEDEAVGATIRTWPLIDDEIRGAKRPVFLSDFLSRRQQRSNPWYVEVQRRMGVEYEGKLLLDAPEGTVRAFFFVRGGRSRDFNEHDRAVLTVLRPHLTAIREDWARRNHPAILTPRELEVLQLVAKGLTNSEIANQLVIASTTVRTHLENIFDKLHVHTRSGAVAAAFQLPLRLDNDSSPRVSDKNRVT
jgi:DNA-binding CsgD family transcriptional regulator